MTNEAFPKCATCNGSGRVRVRVIATEPDPFFDGTGMRETRCPMCLGVGRVLDEWARARVRQTFSEQAARDLVAMVPSHLHTGLRDWIVFGQGVGDFLTAVLTNDLSGAALRADSVNSYALIQIVKWVTWHAPSVCYGSREKFDAWHERGGLAGHRATVEQPSG